jgi:hypothetical protein
MEVNICPGAEVAPCLELDTGHIPAAESRVDVVFLIQGIAILDARCRKDTCSDCD